MKQNVTSSIKKKLILMMVAVSSFGLIVVCIGFILVSYLSHKSSLKQEMTSIVEMIGHYSRPAVDFNDSQAAEETLSALKNYTAICSAMILLADREPLAVYKREPLHDLPLFSEEEPVFSDNHLHITYPIYKENQIAGYVCVQATLKPFYSAMLKVATIIFCLLLFSLFVAYLVSMVLHKKITGPISKLTRGTHRVSEGDFSVKLDIQTNDELEQLAAAFNEMTRAIQRGRDELISAKDYTDKIIFYMLDALIVVDLGLNIKTISPATAILLGYSFPELLNQPAELIFDQKGIDFIEQLRKKESLKNISLNLKSKNHDTVPVSLSGAIMKRPDGNIEGYVFLAKDMRELNRLMEREKEYAVAEATIKESEKKNKELEAAYRELQKVQAQLIQAQKMEAIGRLAGGVAHDFNNQLTVITGYSDLLYQQLKDDALKRKAVEEIKRAGERSAHLTQQLLAFSRKQMILPKIVDASDLIFNMDKMIRRLIGENIELVVIPGENVKTIKVDPVQLEHSIINLVINAKDAMPKGGTLTITTEMVQVDKDNPIPDLDLPEGEFVCIAIKDSGVGITGKIKEHLFEPFFTTKEKGKGTGLGLATSYGIVKQNNGDIRVTSAEGKGTTFRLYFPASEEVPVVTPKGEAEEEMPKGKETILIAEDERSVRDLAVGILMHLGYKVWEAANGEEALSLLEKNGEKKPDLVLTDVIMPRMGGRQLAAELKKKFPDVKIIFMSGYTGQEIDPELVSEKMAYIQKPFKPAALAQKIRQELDDSGNRTKTS